MVTFDLGENHDICCCLGPYSYSFRFNIIILYIYYTLIVYLIFSVIILFLTFLGMKQMSGFLAESQISATYEGKRSCLDWTEGDIALYFEESDCTMNTTTSCSVHISTARYGAFRYSDAVEPITRVYYLLNATPLNTSVTIRIQHNAQEEDIPHLCFITSTDNQPPYNFKVLHGGNFTFTFGEITVNRFSFYSISRLLTKYRVKGILSLLENKYQASLFVSSQPQCLLPDCCCWNIYISVVKNCSIFKRSVEEFIESKYRDVVKCSATKVVHFTQTSPDISVVTTSSFPGPADSQLVASDYPIMKKVDISNFVDGCPPHVKFVLRLARESRHPDVKFKLEGLEEPCNVLCMDQGATQRKLHCLAFKFCLFNNLVVVVIFLSDSCLYASQQTGEMCVQRYLPQLSCSKQIGRLLQK